MRKRLLEVRHKKEKEVRRNQRARAKTYTAEAKRHHSFRELKRMYDRARLLEPLSDRDSSDSDSSVTAEEPIEEIASHGELPTPQAEGNEEASDREPSSEDSGDDSSGHEDGSEEDMDEDASDSEDGSEEDMDEDASDSEDGSEEGEESAEEERTHSQEGVRTHSLLGVCAGDCIGAATFQHSVPDLLVPKHLDIGCVTFFGSIQNAKVSSPCPRPPVTETPRHRVRDIFRVYSKR